MWRYLAGGVAVLMMIAAGVMLFAGRARSDREPLLPAAPVQAATAQAEAPLPASAPEATPRTREEKRFGRYDKDRDGRITREEYLVARRKAYAKLDANGDGRLTFEEWAAKTTTRFAAADRDRSDAMSPAEFATTAPKRSARPRCACPPAQAAREED